MLRLTRKLPRLAAFPIVGTILFLGFRLSLIRSTDEDLRRQAKELSSAVLSNDGKSWNPEHFRAADIRAESWAVFAGDGSLVDIDGFVPGIVPGSVQSPDPASVGTIGDVIAPTGERWRIYVRTIRDGYVIVGFPLRSPCPSDERLRGNSSRFKNDLEAAEKTKYGDLESDTNWAVIDNAGVVQNAFGGIPLRLKTPLS